MTAIFKVFQLKFWSTRSFLITYFTFEKLTISQKEEFICMGFHISVPTPIFNHPLPDLIVKQFLSLINNGVLYFSLVYDARTILWLKVSVTVYIQFRFLF